MATKVDDIKRRIADCTEAEKFEIFQFLRGDFTIHQIENDLNVSAEIILEAIHRASDLSLRGVRGLIAEASFEMNVAKQLSGWVADIIEGDYPYDFLMKDSSGQVRVQVKMQRKQRQAPQLAKRKWQETGKTVYVVETQKTRSGTGEDGQSTRPYRFGEFDILAVSMHPSTRHWDKFMYTVSDWLLPSISNERNLSTFQPVPQYPDDNWTDDFLTCVDWFRLGVKKKIWVDPSVLPL